MRLFARQALAGFTPRWTCWASFVRWLDGLLPFELLVLFRALTQFSNTAFLLGRVSQPWSWLLCDLIREMHLFVPPLGLCLYRLHIFWNSAILGVWSSEDTIFRSCHVTNLWVSPAFLRTTALLCWLFPEGRYWLSWIRLFHIHEKTFWWATSTNVWVQSHGPSQFVISLDGLLFISCCLEMLLTWQ